MTAVAALVATACSAAWLLFVADALRRRQWAEAGVWALIWGTLAGLNWWAVVS